MPTSRYDIVRILNMKLRVTVCGYQAGEVGFL